MGNYSLSPNEGIIARCDGVFHNRKRSEIILTNQNLICVESNDGIFKSKHNEFKYPVNQIKVVDGQAQVFVIKDNEVWTLQVLMKNGTENFRFVDSLIDRIKKKQEADNFAGQISLLLTGKKSEPSAETSFSAGVKGILGAVGINIPVKDTENVTIRCSGCRASLSGQKGQTVKCKYCDTEQTL